MFWSGIPYGFMFIFQTGFRILGLAVEFGSQSLFWSDIRAEFKGIPNVLCLFFSLVSGSLDKQ